jgi:acyl-coenzyme A thioesterase PaaI-like protein
MKLIQSILTKAKSSPFYLWILNHLLWRLIPFNRSHRVFIQSITDTQVRIRLPYRRSNQNHLKGMHACALATLCEYACGIGLMTRIDPKQYRIILKEIKMDYVAQGKTDVFAQFELNDLILEKEIYIPLHSKGSLLKQFSVTGYDTFGKTICKGEITWQLKSWTQVKHT